MPELTLAGWLAGDHKTEIEWIDSSGHTLSNSFVGRTTVEK